MRVSSLSLILVLFFAVCGGGYGCRASLAPVDELERLASDLRGDPENWELRIQYARALLSEGERKPPNESIRAANKAARILERPSGTKAPAEALILRAHALNRAMEFSSALSLLEEEFRDPQALSNAQLGELSEIALTICRDSSIQPQKPSVGVRGSSSSILSDRSLEAAHSLGLIPLRRSDWAEVFVGRLSELFDKGYDRRAAELSSLIWSEELIDSELGFFLGIGAKEFESGDGEIAQMARKALKLYLSDKNAKDLRLKRHIKVADALTRRYYHEDSFTYLDKALEIEPDNSTAMAMQVVILLRMQRLEESDLALNQFIEKQKTPAEKLAALKGLVSELVAFRRTDRILTEAYAIGEAHPEIRLEALKLAASTVQGDSQRDTFRRVSIKVAAELGREEERVELVEILERADARETARKILKPMCTRGGVEALSVCIRLALADNDRQKTEKYAKRFVSLPGAAVFASEILVALRNKGRDKTAAKVVRALLGKPGLALEVYGEEISRNLASEEKSSTPELEDLVQKCVEAYPSGDGALLVARSFANAGRADEALHWYREGISKSEGSDRARYIIESIRVSLKDKEGEARYLAADLAEALRYAGEERTILSDIAALAARTQANDSIRLEALERLVRSDEVLPRTLLALASLKLRMGFSDAAVPLFLRYLQVADTPANGYQRALQEFRRAGAPVALLRLFTEAPDLVRMDPKLVQSTATILERRGSRELARRFYRTLLKLLADDTNARRRLGSQLMRRGYYDEALAFHISVAVEIPPGRYDLTVLRTAIKAGDLDTARVHAERFVSASSRKAQACEHVGNIFYGNLRYEDAYRFMTRAQESSAKGTSPKLLERLLDVSMKIGKADEVKRWIKLLVPDADSRKLRDEYLHTAAEALAQMGLWSEADYYLVRWARRRPGMSSRWLKVAAIRLALDDAPGLVQTLVLAWSKEKEERRGGLLRKFQSLLLSRERPDLLVRVAEALDRKKPGDFRVLMLKGEGLLYLGKSASGAELMREALHAASSPEEIWKRAYDLLSKQAPPDITLRFLREAMVLLPSVPELERVLGDVHMELGNRAKAMDAYERFLSTSPSKSVRVAERLAQSGMYKEALRFYRVGIGHISADSEDKVVEAYIGLSRTVGGDGEARKALAYVLREKGPEPWVLRLCTNALIEAGMVQAAERLMKKLLVREGGALEHRRLGILSYLKGDYTQMDEQMLAYVNHGESNGVAARQRLESPDESVRRILDVADFLRDEGHFERALGWIVRAQRRAPNATEVWLADAHVSLRSGDLSRALSSMTQALKRDPLRAMTKGKSVFDLSIRLGESCAFLPAVQALPKEIGVLRNLALYQLGVGCGDEAIHQTAFEQLIQEESGAGRQAMILLGQLALEGGRFEDSLRVYQDLLTRWSDLSGDLGDERGPDPVVGLIRSLGVLDVGVKAENEDSLQREMRRVIRATWQNASAPARVLNRLTEVLGPQLNRWDYAGELCERLLRIDPARAELWLRRIEIALQRPEDDDVLGVLRRIKSAAGPRRQAFERVRTVWLETGELEGLNEARELLGLPDKPRTSSEAWLRFEEALSALDFAQARAMLDLYLDASGPTVEAHRQAIEVLYDVGWRQEARRRFAEASKKYPEDNQIRWQGLTLDLSDPKIRPAALERIYDFVRRVGVAPRGTEDAPGVEALIELLSGDELIRVAAAASENVRSGADLHILRAVGFARKADVAALRKEITFLDNEGLDVPESLLIVVREVAKEGIEDVALELFSKVRRWSGFLLGSRHLISVLDDLVSRQDLANQNLRAVGRLGVRVTEEYLKVSAPGVASTTSLATFKNAAGLPDEAVLAYSVLAERVPGEASTLNNLAYHNAVTGTQLEEGLIMVNAALKMEPAGAPFYLDTRGWLFYRLGDMEKAARDVESSLRLTPLLRGVSSAEAHAHAAEIALKRGNIDKACRHAIRVKLLEPLAAIGKRADIILQGVFDNPAARRD